MLRELPAELVRPLDSVALRFTLEHFIVNDTPAVQSWEVDAVAHYWGEVDGEGGHREEAVARMTLFKGNLLHADLHDQFDTTDGDLEAVGAALLGPAGDLHDDLEERLEGANGAQLLVLSSVELADRWRGYGVGAYLAGEAILALYGDAECVATIPAPFGVTDASARAKVIRKLERAVGQLGFEEYRDGVWVLDPALVRLSDAVERMRTNFGIG